ncbi:MAG TPA: alpha-glucosidase [Bryobacteraceae bacterium]|nr:alpha-glucosidase [Bryobacteraceae bacterium]
MPVRCWLSLALLASSALSAAAAEPWWKHALIYEIYPRSLQDTDGNGIGDLRGITQRLGYVKSLGANAIWIAPIYPSPEIDFGYDISDYTAIDPMYGSMADFDRLVKEAHGRGIRVIMDLVLNHTSDRHKWFVESESSRNNPKRDWYIWRDGKGPGKPPNNWQSIFGHSAWKYDAKTGQWYYHKFYAEQPDLNWWNPQVRKAMYDVARFWMRKGVDGFRLDAITTLFEEKDLRDEKALGGKNAYGDPLIANVVTDNLPEVHEVLRELRKVTDEFPGRILIGETYLPNSEELMKMYGAHNDELQLPMDLHVGIINKLDVGEFRKEINEAETRLHGNMPLLVFDNHDNPRSWDRYGDGKHNDAIARVIATILLGSRSVAMMYYGQEIGMVTTPPTRKEDVKDPVGLVGWPKDKGRDGERTPMQWDASRNAGFTTGTPWLPIPPNYVRVNVATESKEAGSLLLWYERLIQLRASNAALRDGDETMLDTDNNDVLSWVRKAGDSSVIVACNFTDREQTMKFDIGPASAHVLAANPQRGGEVDLKEVKLPPFGVLVADVGK